jgi:hypothetical protein
MKPQAESCGTDEHLNASTDQSGFPQVLEFIDGKFKPQREHEQDNSYLGKSLDADVGIGDVVQNAAVGQNYPADEVARQQGLPEVGQNEGNRDDAHEDDSKQNEEWRRVIRASGGQQRENHGGQVGKLGNGNEVDFRRAVEAARPYIAYAAGDEYLLVLIRMEPGVHGFPFRRQ